MNDYAELEKRLRESAEYRDPDYETLDFEVVALCAEAADALASLRQERDALRRASADLLFVVNAACKRGDYWHERKAMQSALKETERSE